MEAVLRLEVPGAFAVSWKRVVRGCMVVMFTCILCFSVQRYAENVEESRYPDEVKCSGAKRRENTDLSGTGKSMLADMAGIRVDAERIGTVPGEPLGNVVESGRMEITSDGAIGPAVIRRLDMTSNPGIVKDPGAAVIPGMPVIPVITVEPGAAVKPDMPVIPGMVADSGRTEDPGITDIEITEKPEFTDTKILECPKKPETTDTEITDTEIPKDPGIADIEITENPGITGTEIPKDPGVTDPGAEDVPGKTGKTDMTVTDKPVENEIGKADMTITDRPVEREQDDPAEEDAGLEVIAGFMIDSEGYITGCTEDVVITDDILLLPSDARCTGVRRGALDPIGEGIMEVYIPVNICHIEAGVFDTFSLLMYVEAEAGNPGCYSSDGILYAGSGEVLASPAGR